MKLRNDQIEAIGRPSWEIRRGLRDLFQDAGGQAELDPKTGDLLVRQPRIGTTRLQFGTRGKIETVRSADGRRYRAEYNPQDRSVALVDEAEQRIVLQCDDHGQLVGLTDSSSYRQELDYDEAGRPTALRRPKSPGIQLQYNDHATGSVISVIDGRGNVCRYELDAKGAPLSVIERSGAIKDYAYDDEERLTAVRTPAGVIWRLAHEPETGRQAIFYPDGTHDIRAFRDNDLVWICRRDGTEITYKRRADGALTAAEYSEGLHLEFNYDDMGNIVEADNGTYSVRFEYDETGRPIAEEVDGRRVEVRYDEHGLLAGVTNERGESVAFRHGTDQRVSEVRDWSGKTYLLERDARGWIRGVTFPNRTQWKRRSTSLGTLEWDELRTSSTRITRNYRYDPNDLLLDVSDSERGDKLHEFDDDDRLVSVFFRQQSFEYSYDGHGNTSRIGARTLEYDGTDQLLGGTGFQCRHDGRGNLVEWTEGTAKKRFSYNAQNLLVAVELSDGRRVEYEYDALGRRIRKHCGDVTTSFIWWGEQLLAEEVEGPDPSRTDFLYIPGTLQPLAMRCESETYYFQTDHLDTPIRLINEVGQIVWDAEPHGYDVLVLQNQVRQPLRFPGQYHDEETGLFYNVARYYHPGVGRYLTADPLFFEDQTNRYLYAKANPAAFVDPSGRFVFCAILVAAVAGAAIGAAFAGAKKIADNKAQDKPWHDGLMGALGTGALFGGVGGLAIGLGAPVVGVAAAGLALGPTLAAINALPGHTMEACLDAIPVLGAFRRQAKNAADPHADAQFGVDIVFDTLGVGLAFLGARGTRGGPAPPKPATVWKPVLQPAMQTAGGPRMAPGGIVWEPVAVPVVPAAPTAAGAVPMAMTNAQAAGSGGVGGGGSDDNGEDREELKERSKKGDKDATYELNKTKAKEHRSHGDEKAAQGPEAENKVIDQRGDRVVKAGEVTETTEIDVETKTEVVQVKSGKKLPSDNQTEGTRAHAQKTGKKPTVIYDPNKVKPSAVNQYKQRNPDFELEPWDLEKGQPL